MAAIISARHSDKTWNVNIGTSVPYLVFEKLESIVAEENAARAVVIRKLLLRGIAAYELDGKLDEASNGQD
jgi:hypothetical protein